MLKSKLLEKTAITAARLAGKELMRRYDRFDRATVELKSHHEILTKADLASEKIILGRIKKDFPGHRILSEEKGDSGRKSEYLWVVDPLDGSTNFSIHNPLWSVSIGVFYRRKIVLGVIFAPFLSELYVAAQGQNAFRNGRRIGVSKITTGKVINTFCHGSRNRDIRKALDYARRQKIRHLDCRQLGSAAIELAYVASGRIESIMIPGAHAWDVAAGVLLVRAAGGKVTDFSGKNWTLDSEDILASNGRVHREILNTINR